MFLVRNQRTVDSIYWLFFSFSLSFLVFCL